MPKVPRFGLIMNLVALLVLVITVVPVWFSVKDRSLADLDAAMIALLTPFLLLTAILLPLTICFSNALYKLAFAVLLGLHLGSCSGDLYDTLLFLFRYREPDTLVRDTGPEQTIYCKNKV